MYEGASNKPQILHFYRGGTAPSGFEIAGSATVISIKWASQIKQCKTIQKQGFHLISYFVYLIINHLSIIIIKLSWDY